MPDLSTLYDAIVVGAGPAGLSAALVLGRCRRRVLVCDAGSPRNRAARRLNGFLTRDGIEPSELLRIGRNQLAPYGVELMNAQATEAQWLDGVFTVVLDHTTRRSSLTLLLATGLVDELPMIDGFMDFYGRSVFHCPYCDGREVRDTPLAVYGRGRMGAGLALSLTTWSHDLVLCTDGPARLDLDLRERLASHEIALEQSRIARLEGRDGQLERIVFVNGRSLARRAMFFATGQAQRSALAASLGCEFTARGVVRTNQLQGTAIRGLYVAGDASRDVQLAIVAAAEGAKAAFAMNLELQEREGRTVDVRARERPRAAAVRERRAFR